MSRHVSPRPHEVKSGLRCLLTLALFSLVAVAQPGLPGAGGLQKPSDPEKVRGSFEIDGERRVVTEGEFYATYLLLKPHSERPERPMRPEQVLEHILLFAEAESLGLAPSEEEIATLNPIKSGSPFAEQIRARWTSMGITEADFERFTRETRAVQRLKDWFANTVRVTSEETHEDWKRDNLRYVVDYLAFPAQRYIADLKNTPPTDDELARFLESNPTVQQRFRRPARVDAALLVFDPSRIDAAELDRRRSQKVVTYEEALAHYRKHRERFDAMIPSQERPKLYPPVGTVVPVQDLVTPFQLVRDQIERELLFGDPIGAAFKDLESATSPEVWKSVAAEHGLELRHLQGASLDDLTEKAADLGPNLGNVLLAASPGVTCQEIQNFAGRRFAWRVFSREESTTPKIAEVRNLVLLEWFRVEASRRAQEEANKLMEAVNSAVDQQKRAELDALDADAGKRAEEEIKSRNITDERTKEMTRQRFMALAENQKRVLRQSASPEVLTKTAYEMGLKFERFGPFAFDPQRVQRDANAPLAEQLRDFFGSSYPVRSLEAGQVSTVLSDAVTDTQYIVKVIERTEPPFAEMPAVDFYQRRLQKERQASFNTNFQWSGFQAMRRLNWTEGK